MTRTPAPDGSCRSLPPLGSRPVDQPIATTSPGPRAPGRADHHRTQRAPCVRTRRSSHHRLRYVPQGKSRFGHEILRRYRHRFLARNEPASEEFVTPEGTSRGMVSDPPIFEEGSRRCSAYAFPGDQGLLRVTNPKRRALPSAQAARTRPWPPRPRNRLEAHTLSRHVVTSGLRPLTDAIRLRRRSGPRWIRTWLPECGRPIQGVVRSVQSIEEVGDSAWRCHAHRLAIHQLPAMCRQ